MSAKYSESSGRDTNIHNELLTSNLDAIVLHKEKKKRMYNSRKYSLDSVLRLTIKSL